VCILKLFVKALCFISIVPLLLNSVLIFNRECLSTGSLLVAKTHGHGLASMK
jgi:hypothetical protein